VKKYASLLAAAALLAIGTAAWGAGEGESTTAATTEQSAMMEMELMPDPTGRQMYAVPKMFHESPLLAARVAAGELPPIDERIPVEPFVVGPGVLNSEQWLDWEVGQHGGTIRVPNLNNSGVHEIYLALGMSILRAPDQSSKDPLPAIVSEYDISEDFTKFCFTIRDGLRWSDGELVTTEDVRMTFELYADERIYPTFYFRAAAPDGSPPVVTIIDDLSFCVEFNQPYGFFLANLSSWIPDYTLLFRPAHFIKRFHADYTPMDEIQPVLDDLEIETWEQLVQQKDMQHWELHRAHGLDVPSLAPWVGIEATSTGYTLERNAYYWKVDVAGSQLPYADYIVAENSADLEAIKLNTAAGEYDVVTSYAQLKELPIYLENADKGIATVLHGSINNPPVLFLNQDFEYDTEGSAWQMLMNDKRFGKALALAVDKDDVNENVYFGQYKLDTITDREYDPAQSDQLLDAAGMDKRDGDGFRLGPDGNPFTLDIITANVSPDFLLVGELFKQYFEEIGVRTSFTVLGSQIWGQRQANNEHMATVHWSDRPIWAPGISEDFGPYAKGDWAAQSWAYYQSDGETGRKPPPYMEEYIELWEAWKVYPPQSPEGEAAFANLMDWFSRNYVSIWPTGSMTVPTVYNADLGNVIKEGYPFDRALDYGMEQLFYRTMN
jgi:peptide/nickel transport system substrate-binding protein